MGKLGQGESEDVAQQDLAGGVGQMIFAPDDVGHLHQAVVDNRSEIVRSDPLRAENDKIPDLSAIEGHPAFDPVFEFHTSGIHPETEGRRTTRGNQRSFLFWFQIATAAVVLRRNPPGQ